MDIIESAQQEQTNNVNLTCIHGAHKNNRSVNLVTYLSITILIVLFSFLVNGVIPYNLKLFSFDSVVACLCI